MLKRLLITVFFIFGVSLFIPKPALAYLDPGSGSYLIQVIIAFIAGGGILFKTQREKINKVLSKKNKAEKEKKKDEK